MTSNELYSIHSIASISAEGMTEESSPEDEGSVFDDADILPSATDSVTAQLISAGPAGVAAAAAIASGKKRRRLHSFETNPSIRKRQQTRLLRKLCALMEEYIVRVGQQAVIVCCTPGKAQQQPHAYRVFGSQPLESVMRNHKSTIMNELEQALAIQTPPAPDTSMMYDLPPLAVDGIPTPLDKMTQAQLRYFIPEMLKFSTGKSKPGWGKPECRPPWWPDDVPWANVRSDVRDDETKRMVSWTAALRKVVLNCYHHHGREDLLPDYKDNSPTSTTLNYMGPQSIVVQHINNPDGSVSLVHIDTGDTGQPQQMVTLSDGTQARVVHTIPNGILKAQGNSQIILQGTSLFSEDGSQVVLTGGNLYTLQSGLQNSLTHLQVQDLQAVSIPSNHFEEITSEAINDHSSQIRPITVTVIPQNNESDDVDGTHHHPDLDDSDYTMDMMAAASDNT